MNNERETAIRTEAEALANMLIAEHSHAAIHLARLVRADYSHAALWWYAQRLTDELNAWPGETRHLQANDVYSMLQAAARSLAGDADD